MKRDRVLCVLLIDDSDADAFLVEEALNNMGRAFELERFEDGADALAALRSQGTQRHAPDIVLLDLEMPRSDGLEVLRELRRIPGLEWTPVALFTTELPSAFRHEPVPPVRCVKKPLNLDDFLATVERTVRELAGFEKTGDEPG